MTTPMLRRILGPGLEVICFFTLFLQEKMTVFLKILAGMFVSASTCHPGCCDSHECNNKFSVMLSSISQIKSLECVIDAMTFLLLTLSSSIISCLWVILEDFFSNLKPIFMLNCFFMLIMASDCVVLGLSFESSMPFCFTPFKVFFQSKPSRYSKKKGFVCFKGGLIHVK